jgi:hypothetical protein
MKPIPLNLMTIYADVLQSLEMADHDAASIATKTIKNKRYVYATKKDGSARIEMYLGPADDPAVQAEVGRLRNAAERAKHLRSSVTLLKASRLPAPSLILGRILEVVANAGLFNRGMTLVGTAAYQTYAPVLGYYLPTATYATNDVALSVAEFVPGENEEDFHTLLKRADKSFEPLWSRNDKLPKAFRASNGFIVELLTRFGRGHKSPVLIESLNAAAVPLSFQEYLAEVTMEAAALYGHGVLVRVPTPARFAVHKLIIAQRRKPTARAKRQKDLRQAEELIDILLEMDESTLQSELDGARERGRRWKSQINASLREMGRDIRQGRPPIAMASKTRRRGGPR